MTDSILSCPTPDCLKAFVEGTVPESELLATQTHVEDCTSCQRALENLVAGSDSWASALGKLRKEPSDPHETVLSDAIKRMKAEDFVDGVEQSDSSASPLEFLAPSSKPGSIGKLGPYEVTEVIGQGGMGVVVKAFDPALHRIVAVKVLAPYLAHDPRARKRFVREAQAIAAVSHDHVITIHAIDESAEQPKIVMQFVSGQSLQQKIDADGSLELTEILRIGMQTAAGLAAAHAQGLVHRDVKPSNIWLEDGIQRVKLTDFGLARAVDDASLTQSGAIAGTPQYMAPEQANGDPIDHRADLFSLGSVLYAMCVGHSPFRANTTMGVLKRVCHDPPEPIQELNAGIPDWLCGIVMKLLAKKPEDRFQSAKSVADLLEKWLAHVQQPTVAPRPLPLIPDVTANQSNLQPPEIPIRTRKQRSWYEAVMSLSFSVIAAVISVITWFTRSVRKSLGYPPDSRNRFKSSRLGASLEKFRIKSASWNKAYPLEQSDVSSLQNASAEPNSPGSPKPLNATLGPHDYLHRLHVSIDKLFDPAFSERNRLLLVIGWCLVGGFDLVSGASSNSSDAPPFWFLLSVMSFALAHSISARQNPGFVRAMSFIGLIPLSVGSLGRIFLSILTLLWQHSPDVQKSFEATPFSNSKLGKAVNGTLSFGKRSLGTIMWLTLWACVWLLMVTGTFLFLVVPYGPSNYEIYDKATVTLKGLPDKRFELVAVGSGEITGLQAPVQRFRCQQIGMGQVGGTREQQIVIPLTEPLTSDKVSEELTRELAKGLQRIFNESYPEHAASLAKSAQRLNVNQSLNNVEESEATAQQKSVVEKIHGFEESIHHSTTPWKGFARFGTLLDPEFFQVELDSNESQFTSQPSTNMLLIFGIATVLVWLYVLVWIVKRRHFQ